MSHVLYQIVITQTLNDDGVEVYSAEFHDFSAAEDGGDPPLIPWIQGLGMLEAAKDDFKDQTFELGQYDRRGE